MEGERRNGDRAPFQGWVEITAAGQRRLGTGRDLSPRGIGARVPSPPPNHGEPVVAEFTLPGISLPLAIEGRVVWRDPATGQMGVRFEGVDSGVAELLENYVDGRL